MIDGIVQVNVWIPRFLDGYEKEWIAVAGFTMQIGAVRCLFSGYGGLSW